MRFEDRQGSGRVSADALQREGLEVTLAQPNSAAIIHLRKVRLPMSVAAAPSHWTEQAAHGSRARLFA